MNAPCTGSDALVAQVWETLVVMASPGGLAMLGFIGILIGLPLAYELMTRPPQGRR
jgi:hypothetical protein